MESMFHMEKKQNVRSPVDHESECGNQSKFVLSPLSLTSDQDRISPYTINTIASRQVVRIKKNTNWGIIGRSNSPN